MIQIEGKEIAIFQFGGKFYAIDNVCPHRGGPLGEGAIDEGAIMCPWHAWSFDIKSGKCRSADFNQPTFPAKAEGEEVMIDL